MNSVLRYDTSSVQEWRDDGRGGLVSPAHGTRIGVFEYSEYDPQTGKTRTWGELRDPEHVFDRKSLDTLKAVPVTDLHPTEGMVTALNWQRLARGHVGDDVHVNGDRVAITLHIQDGKLAQMARDGERQDISLGYRTDLVHKPGVWRGVSYDYIQTNIRYNHAAVGPKNWGRAGPRVGLRTDSRTNSTQQPPAGLAPTRQRQPTMSIITITTKNDGRTLEVGAQTFDLKEGPKRLDAARAAVAQVQSARMDRVNALKKDASPEEIQGWIDTVTGAMAGLENAVLEMSGYLMAAEESATDPEMIPAETMDAAVKVRTDVLARAKALKPDGNFDGKSNHDIRVEALTGRFDAAVLGKASAEYVEGLFAGASITTNDERDGLLPNGKTKTDGKDGKSYKADARAAAGNRWNRDK